MKRPTGVNDYSAYWVAAELTEEERAKCLLMGIEIFVRNIGSEKYVISRCDRDHGGYVRPIIPRANGDHVEVNTFEECVQLWADPSKFGGRWG